MTFSHQLDKNNWYNGKLSSVETLNTSFNIWNLSKTHFTNLKSHNLLKMHMVSRRSGHIRQRRRKRSTEAEWFRSVQSRLCLWTSGAIRFLYKCNQKIRRHIEQAQAPRHMWSLRNGRGRLNVMWHLNEVDDRARLLYLCRGQWETGQLSHSVSSANEGKQQHQKAAAIQPDEALVSPG